MVHIFEILDCMLLKNVLMVHILDVTSWLDATEIWLMVQIFKRNFARFTY